MLLYIPGLEADRLRYAASKMMVGPASDPRVGVHTGRASGPLQTAGPARGSGAAPPRCPSSCPPPVRAPGSWQSQPDTFGSRLRSRHQGTQDILHLMQCTLSNLLMFYLPVEDEGGITTDICVEVSGAKDNAIDIS